MEGKGLCLAIVGFKRLVVVVVYLYCLLWFGLFSYVILIQQLHVGVQKNFNKREDKIKYKPDIHHLDIRGVGEAFADTDEQGYQH